MDTEKQHSDIIIKNLNKDQIKDIRQFIQTKKWNIDVRYIEEKTTICGDTKYHIAPIETESKCPYCFCQPCITHELNRQLWWGNGSKEPHVENSGLRKRCYQRFWAMMTHRHVWNTEEYIIKKEQMLAGQNHQNVIVFRDIMPDCVLKVVRGWFPNPKNIPYMGHKWN